MSDRKCLRFFYDAFENGIERKEFGEEEPANLSLKIITINGWNLLAIGFRRIPGEYQPHKIG